MRAGGFLAWLCLAQVALADDDLELALRDGGTLTLPRFEHADIDVRIDGRLDEAPWAAAPVIDRMRVIEPELLSEARYSTRLRLFYTDRGLYVGFDNEQPPDTLVKRLSQRDDGRLNRDNVSFTLDTSGEGRYGYWMNLALGDNQTDGTILPERQYSRDWDGAWYGATAEHAHGWSAEFFIPWSQMAMPEQHDHRRIGLYVSRKVAHLNERWGWPALPGSRARFMSDLQQIDLQAVNPKQQWSLFPFTVATVDGVADDTFYKAGFDVFWRPSTNFQLTATANPDFGNVESDDVVVNLTADETFFPEKRLFFLEGREIFTTTPRANADDKVTLVNTRRIGGPPRLPVTALSFPISEREQSSELYGALKLTGQAGGVRYGLLGAAEEDVKLHSNEGPRLVQDGRDFGVARVLYEDNHLGAYRALGWIGTYKGHPASDALVNGIDFHYLTANGAWRYDGQLIHSDVDGGGSGLGALLDLEYTRRVGLKYTAALSHYDADVNINDLGYQRRNDASEARLGAEWLRTDIDWARNLRVEPFLRYERNGDGLMTKAGVGSNVRISLNNFAEVEANVAAFPERYEDRNSFGNGTFRIEERATASLKYTTDTSRRLSGFVGTTYRGEDISGSWWRHTAGFTWRPVDRLTLLMEAEYGTRGGWLLHQEDRNMTAFSAREWQPKLNLDFFLSAKQQFRLALQWVGIRARERDFYLIPTAAGDLLDVDKPPGPSDDFSISQLNVQLRYRWQIAPLSDLFLVYTRSGYRVEDEASGFGDLFDSTYDDPVGDQLVLKLRYRIGT